MSRVLDAQIVVIAKAPRPGLAKTRLSPPCTPQQAAALAAAALTDTLAAVRSTPVRRRVLAFDDAVAGDYDGDYDPAAGVDLGGFAVIAQRGAGLGARLAHAFADAAAGLPTLLIGMDTPQVSADLLTSSLTLLGSTDAVLGRATDGGWWALGMQDVQNAGVLAHVPMSRSDTARLTERALLERGVRLAALPELTDVDTFDDALAVAADAPGSHFALQLAVVTGLIAS